MLCGGDRDEAAHVAQEPRVCGGLGLNTSELRSVEEGPAIEEPLQRAHHGSAINIDLGVPWSAGPKSLAGQRGEDRKSLAS